MTRADLRKQPFDVARMFDGVAARYDLVNDIAALGQVRSWRRAMVDAVAPTPGAMVLDVAAGTGTSTEALRRAGARALAADFSAGMVAEGRERHRQVPFVLADATRLPFADDAFDAATISFGLRNVQEPMAAVREMMRVVRPGGRIVICEFSTPTPRLLRAAYRTYLPRVMTRMARFTSSAPEAYQYLAESIAAWPDQEALREQLHAQGLGEVRYRNLTGGIVALHRGVVPADRAR
ncbi:demethylmenaquinone methyltransferase [Brachybacterium sp. EF45031]|uniref:demethylmenaquinone methyltransferase n=1 Tax=Brachybacterium sillae TaxID=2810536 RepID=UPI00217D2B95|nr:demethylmenaquinone methyltransferase [Brachybacterium sillae]MCS6712672.1 demethylmenaquinone methyltransferase [Brachybacterium sillae]